MKKIRIGILGAADIAKRRFLPALEKAGEFQFVGIAVASAEEWNGSSLSEEEYAPLFQKKLQKAQELTELYNGKVFKGYEELLKSDEIDAVYIPLPPSLHYKWGKLAIKYGKHVLLEKPATTSLAQTEELLKLAEEKRIAINENYAFVFHKQVGKITSLLKEHKIGELRLIRIAFGFPYRNGNDFRYQADMGGGALLDCGGYTLKAAQLFMGRQIRLMTSNLNHTDMHDVDLFGSAVLQDENGLVAQVSFGMDNAYKCELEIWGSEGTLLAPRFFTPPADFEAEIRLKNGQGEEIIRVEGDDQFLHTIEEFSACINNHGNQRMMSLEMRQQMRFVHEIQENASV